MVNFFLKKFFACNGLGYISTLPCGKLKEIALSVCVCVCVCKKGNAVSFVFFLYMETWCYIFDFPQILFFSNTFLNKMMFGLATTVNNFPLYNNFFVSSNLMKVGS